MTNELKIIGSIALNRVFGFSPQVARKLIAMVGSPEAFAQMTDKQLCELIDPCSKYHSMLNTTLLDSSYSEYKRLTSQGYSFICSDDDSYPSLLLDCPDYPIILYVRSDTEASNLFNRCPCVSIVGTRDISPYGKEWCTRIVRALSEVEIKPLIISGLAYGVDITAHSSAIAMGLSTIAVSPVGIDTIYPYRHSIFASKMAAIDGSAIITDYPPGTSPLPFTFLRRNRIIAGISDATILIESKVKGGGMMTARLAASYGRVVYALPGRIDDLRSGGCNQLLGEKLADTIYSLDALVESLGLEAKLVKKRANPTEAVKNRFENNYCGVDCDAALAVYSQILSQRGICMDELCSKTGWGYARISHIVGVLEAEGFISTDLFQRCSIVI